MNHRLTVAFDEPIDCLTGRAYEENLQPKRTVMGADVRHTSEPLKAALAEGLMGLGEDVVDIRLAGTEKIFYVAVFGRLGWHEQIVLKEASTNAYHKYVSMGLNA